jgi:hypothetical protein
VDARPLTANPIRNAARIAGTPVAYQGTAHDTHVRGSASARSIPI